MGLQRFRKYFWNLSESEIRKTKVQMLFSILFLRISNAQSEYCLYVRSIDDDVSPFSE